ncbi:pyridoxine/pyridoxamine 5'-phosphate oxidase 2 isoform X1 [Momordica charantia]|uniref:pyridoxal 5'-phosphate synthase n=1 Tax=Momordica charantia TaxID=3673 RepID=A0A6J1D2F2_MOMCH|nr:pyridoxine/pyridoxamine 5'-phosphate oxidase 2 isoform X1 [Momordica charantia]
MGSAAAPWKSLLLTALESNGHIKHSQFLQLATVGANGRPSNRTVVFRGFQEGSDNIQINTDSRSRKVEELKNCPFAEICWYFTESWEQFRISGRVEVVDSLYPDAIKLQQREKAWSSIPSKTRMQYLGPNPGLPYLTGQPAKENLQDSSSGPVDSYCLLVFNPDQVDYVNLKSEKRFLYKASSSSRGEKLWSTERINP